MKQKYAVAIGSFLILCVPQNVSSQEICAALLAQGIRDTSSNQISESRFNELKSNVCNSNYDSYSKAAQKAMNGGFDLPGIFGISFGSSNSNQEYGTKWSNFCKSDYSTAMSNTETKSYFSTANRAVLNSFDNCVNNTSERFIRYIEPQANGKTFAIIFNNRRQGVGSFEIVKISLTNATSGQVIKFKDACDFDHELPWKTGSLNAISIVCRKSPEDSIVVSGTTTAGNIDPIEVPAITNPSPTVEDRISKIEGGLLSVKQDIKHSISKVEEADKKLSDRIENLGKNDKRIDQPGTFNTQTGICPPGTFMVGVRHQLDSGEKNGVTSWLGYICRSLN